MTAGGSCGFFPDPTPCASEGPPVNPVPVGAWPRARSTPHTREAERGFLATTAHRPCAVDILAIAGCSHGVAPWRAKPGRGRPFSPTFDDRLRPRTAGR